VEEKNDGRARREGEGESGKCGIPFPIDVKAILTSLNISPGDSPPAFTDSSSPNPSPYICKKIQKIKPKTYKEKRKIEKKRRKIKGRQREKKNKQK
jgi:hypothetical protein